MKNERKSDAILEERHDNMAESVFFFIKGSNVIPKTQLVIFAVILDPSMRGVN